jgi:hypothetical protein
MRVAEVPSMKSFAVACVLACAALAACSPNGESKGGFEQSRTSPLPEVQVTMPKSHARVKSPLDVEGVAPNLWYFEAIFPAKLVDKDGKVLAEAPAQAQSDWTKPGPVNFKVHFEFSVAAETPASIVLEKDATGENKEIRTVHIPIVLEPAG